MRIRRTSGYYIEVSGDYDPAEGYVRILQRSTRAQIKLRRDTFDRIAEFVRSGEQDSPARKRPSAVASHPKPEKKKQTVCASHTGERRT